MPPDAKPTEPEDKPPFSDKLADILVKVLMTGGVAGGGLGAFWSLFKESDIPKAIASGVIGLGITYGASLLKPLHEGTQRRLGKAGQTLDEAIDGGIDQLFATVTRAEDAYLLCQALDCRDYKSEGMGKRDRIMTPMLQEVFVPLELDTAAIPASFQRQSPRALQAFAEFQRSHCIWDFLAQAEREPAYRQLAIVAWGGFGKTTLLKHLAYIYGTKQHRRFKVRSLIPVLLPLRQYRQHIIQTSPPTLPELVMQAHVAQLAKLDPQRRLAQLPSH